MIATTLQNTITDAVIYLKDGKRKYGKLIENTPTSDSYQFISNNNVPFFNETNSIEYIESVPGVLIEAIETDLK